MPVLERVARGILHYEATKVGLIKTMPSSTVYVMNAPQRIRRQTSLVGQGTTMACTWRPTIKHSPNGAAAPHGPSEGARQALEVIEACVGVATGPLLSRGSPMLDAGTKLEVAA